MKIIVDCRMKDRFINYFKSSNIECIKLNPVDNIYEEISSHVDIFCTLLDDLLICASNIKLSSKLGINIIYGEKVEDKYPSSAKYNICRSGRYIICNSKYIDENIKKYILDKGFNIINVNQGYTKCSLIALNETNYITSDIGIKNVLEENGFNVLYLENEDIKLLRKDGLLSDMNGFIGGATCILENKLILFGDSKKLKNGQAFKEFLGKNGYELIDFDNEEIIDYGSAVIIPE